MDFIKVLRNATPSFEYALSLEIYWKWWNFM